nr:hypothetical protein [Paracoccus saliphilus]
MEGKMDVGHLGSPAAGLPRFWHQCRGPALIQVRQAQKSMSDRLSSAGSFWNGHDPAMEHRVARYADFAIADAARLPVHQVAQFDRDLRCGGSGRHADKPALDMRGATFICSESEDSCMSATSSMQQRILSTLDLFTRIRLPWLMALRLVLSMCCSTWRTGGNRR